MIIASTYNVDPHGPKLDFIIPLPETPFPGDTIKLAVGGKVIRVLRREFNELVIGDDDRIDVNLGVRLA